jgi:hypothetical protein
MHVGTWSEDDDISIANGPVFCREAGSRNSYRIRSVIVVCSTHHSQSHVKAGNLQQARRSSTGPDKQWTATVGQLGLSGLDSIDVEI